MQKSHRNEMEMKTWSAYLVKVNKENKDKDL